LRSSGGIADEELHRHAAQNLEQADALLFGRVIYQMMEEAWREPAQTGVMPDWMEPWMLPFARTTDAAKKYVVSSALDRVDWNAELVRGDLGMAVEGLKRESDRGPAHGRRDSPAGAGRAGLDRRIRVDRPSPSSRPRPNALRRLVEAHRLEAREPAGVGLGRRGDAVSAEEGAVGMRKTVGSLR